jgi:hypothetical protein
MVDEYAYLNSRCVQKCIQIFMSTVSYISSVLCKSEMAWEFLTQFPSVNFMTIHLLIYEFLHGHRQTGQWFSLVLQSDSDITETNICSFLQNKSLINQLHFPHMYAICFGMYLGHPEACQLICRKKQQKSNRSLLKFTVFTVLKDHTKYVTKHIRRMSLLKVYK